MKNENPIEDPVGHIGNFSNYKAVSASSVRTAT